MDDLINHLKIKVVTEDDEENVLSIRNPDEVYDGHDYLPDKFKRLINFPNSTGYAVFHGKKCIAFALVCIFDDGETYVVRAVRIAKQYEGKGIIKWFLGEVNRILKATSTVKYRVSGSYSGDVKTACRVRDGRCYTVVDRERIYYVNEIAISKIKSNFANINLQHLTVIDTNAAFSRILDLDFVKDGTYGRRLFVNNIPFRPIKSNASLMMQDTTMMIGSNLENIDRFLITFESRFEAFVGTVVNIHTYGHVSYNLQNHIMLHLKCALDACNSKHVTFILCYDSDISKTLVDKIMQTCGFITKDIGQKGWWCVETKLCDI